MTTTAVALRAASTTPATSFHGDGTGTGILDAALIAASWVFVEMSTAATQGTNGNVYVWRDASTRFYVAIEAYDGTATAQGYLKFRAAEAYNSANDKFNQPVDGRATTLAVTPTINSTVTDTEGVISTHGVSLMGAVTVRTSFQGFMYALRVTADVLTLGTTNQDSGASRGCFVQVGHMTSLFQATSDTHPLFLGGGPDISQAAQALNDNGVGPSWAGNTGSLGGATYRASRAPGIGAVSATGAFAYCADYPMPIRTQGAVISDSTHDMYGAPGSPANGKYPTGYSGAIAGQATLHNRSSAAVHGQGILRAYIPDTIIYITTNGGTQSISMGAAGDSVTCNGTTYYVLGLCVYNAAVTISNGGLMLAVKA